MSLERIETMLNSAPQMRTWLSTSKTLRWMKSYNIGAPPLVRFMGMVATMAFLLWSLSNVSPDTPSDVLHLIGMSSFLIIFMVPVGVILTNLAVGHWFSKIWNKKTFFTGERNIKSLEIENTTAIKCSVVENFLQLQGEEWDALAPVLHTCIQEDGLPYLWWSDLNAHLVQNLPLKDPDPAPVQTVTVQSLEEQLHHRAQMLKNTNHVLSI